MKLLSTKGVVADVIYPIGKSFLNSVRFSPLYSPYNTLFGRFNFFVKLNCFSHASFVSICLRRTISSTTMLQTVYPNEKEISKLIPKKAAAVIIGNEILTGKVMEKNIYVLANTLFEIGIPLERVEIIPDVEESIVQTLHKLSPRVDYLITTGGIGPTHDDITYQSVAKAFNLKLSYHEPTLELMKQFMSSPINEARKRMALIPEGATLHSTPGLWVPLVVVNNVFIFPGVPKIFQKMLEANKSLFSGGVKIYRAILRTKKLEGDIALALSNCQKEFPGCEIGSYPQTAENDERSVMVSFESSDKAILEQAVNRVMKEIDGVREDKESIAPSS
jgi:molybdenum cofactor synthesis domain-containing protein